MMDVDKPVICGREAEQDKGWQCPTCSEAAPWYIIVGGSEGSYSYRYYKCVPCNEKWEETVPDNWVSTKPAKPKDYTLLSEGGPGCPHCGKPTQVRQRTFSPYGYCANNSCHVRVIHGEAYRLWGFVPF